jgi:uncharacterized protein (TIGR03083 family)
MRPVEPVLTVDLFPEERGELLRFLAGLSDVQWSAPTVCAGWSVKDIALHLLGDDMSVLSRGRDGAPGTFRGSWDELLAFINRSNALWVEATRRLSARLLCELLDFTGEALHRHFASLDLHAMGNPVSWAGPGAAPVWLDVAREYTERWLHHQQMRDAVAAPGLTKPHFFAPVLDTFVRALPHTYRDVAAADRTLFTLTVTGDAGGDWCLVRSGGTWQLVTDITAEPDARASLDQDTAWRLFTRGIEKDTARRRTVFAGDEALAARVLDMVSIIA